MTTTTAPTRVVDGVELPAAGTWSIDPGHAEVGFVGRHLVFTKVRGRFRGVEGAVVIGDDPADTTVDVVIDVASVDSGDETRDDHLRSAELFDVATFPTVTFTNARVTGQDGATFTVVGDLTIKGVTRRVVLDAEYLGFQADPWGGERAIFSAAGDVNREDFGVTWNMVLETGGVLVSKEIRLEIEVELVRQAQA